MTSSGTADQFNPSLEERQLALALTTEILSHYLDAFVGWSVGRPGDDVVSFPSPGIMLSASRPACDDVIVFVDDGETVYLKQGLADWREVLLPTDRDVSRLIAGMWGN